MTNKHPITPPSELVKQHWDEPQFGGCFAEEFATFFARWGADQELEACCAWLHDTYVEDPEDIVPELRATRRHKPPSLKEQALAALGWLSIEPCLINGVDVNAAVRAKYDTIRTALEALPNE
jgi:hypothetical protein